MTEPMDPIALAALRASIAHWRQVVADGATPIGIAHCALCHEFHSWASNANYQRMEAGVIAPRCGSCPIVQRHGPAFAVCNNTPYTAYSDLLTDGPDFDETARVAAAQAELDFLLALLPDGVSPDA